MVRSSHSSALPSFNKPGPAQGRLCCLLWPHISSLWQGGCCRLLPLLWDQQLPSSGTHSQHITKEKLPELFVQDEGMNPRENSEREGPGWEDLGGGWCYPFSFYQCWGQSSVMSYPVDTPSRPAVSTHLGRPFIHPLLLPAMANLTSPSASGQDEAGAARGTCD